MPRDMNGAWPFHTKAHGDIISAIKDQVMQGPLFHTRGGQGTYSDPWGGAI